MGTLLSSCASARGADGDRAHVDKPRYSKAGKPVPRNRPEVVPASDGAEQTPSPAAGRAQGGFDPVPDVLPLEAAAQWARDKRLSRRQNSAPATPASLTFTYIENDGDRDCHEGRAVTSTVLMRRGPEGAASSSAAEVFSFDETSAAIVQRESDSLDVEVVLRDVRRKEEAISDPLVLLPVPKRLKSVSEDASSSFTYNLAHSVPTNSCPPPSSKLLGMALPPIPIARGSCNGESGALVPLPMLPPKPKHLSIVGLALPVETLRLPASNSPLLPPRRLLSQPSISSTHWESVETLVEATCLAHEVWDTPYDDSGDHRQDNWDAKPLPDEVPLIAEEEEDEGTDKVLIDLSPSEAPKKTPRKPPRTYSYKAASQPKRISHTTEEFIEIWDTMRRALSLEKLNEDEALSEKTPTDGVLLSEGGTEVDNDDDDDIYQNLYAARMRCWQVLSLAQDVVVDMVDADDVLEYMRAQNLLSEDDYDAIVNITNSNKERNDAVIDYLLERGDGYFDKYREFLRCSQGCEKVSRILDALNEVFIIGSKANHWTFSLTTKQCSVSYETSESLLNLSNAPDIATSNYLDPAISLDIYHENFGNRSCTAVADMLRRYDIVRRLSLVKNGISQSGVVKLAPGLVGGKALKHLSLRLNPLRNDGLAELVEGALCRHDCSLAELNLSHTGLASGCGATLARMLRCVPALRRIDLSHNELDDRDCSTLADGLADNGTVTDLCLRGNAFGAAGCARICSAAATRVGMQLSTLDVSQNRVGDSGAATLARLLATTDDGPDRHCCDLLELRLENCAVGAVGCAAVAAALKNNGRLDALFISGNAFGDAGLQSLAAALGENKALRVLYTDLCAASASGLATLLQVLNTSNTSLSHLSACFVSATAPSCRSMHESSAVDGCMNDLESLAASARKAISGRKIVI